MRNYCITSAWIGVSEQNLNRDQIMQKAKGSSRLPGGTKSYSLLLHSQPVTSHFPRPIYSCYDERSKSGSVDTLKSLHSVTFICAETTQCTPSRRCEEPAGLCPVCKGNLTDPKRLLCGHSCCLRCAGNWRRDMKPGEAVYCQLCKKECKVEKLTTLTVA